MKKILALLLSVAMVASMFVGVAFATTPTAVLNVSVTGVVALDHTILVQGSVLNINGLPATILYAVLQHRAPLAAATDWTNIQTLWDRAAVSPLVTFSALAPLTSPGDYRVALTSTATGAALTATGSTPVSPAVPLVHTIGSIAPPVLTITPGVTAVIRDLTNTVIVPLTMTRVVGGATQDVVGADLVGGEPTVTFAATIVPAANVTLSAAPLMLTVTLPLSPVSGTLVINATTIVGHFTGSASVRVEPRATFNALITHDPLATGTATVFRVTVFDAEGDGPGVGTANSFAYARASLAGPFGAPAAIPILGAGPEAFASVTPRHGGTITVTVEFFNSAHSVLHTLTRTFTVAGWNLALPTRTFVRNSAITLRAVITDAAGNPVNNARVRFISPTGSAMFSLRTDTGVFTAAGAALDEASVNGLVPVQPRGSAVVNGEYSLDAILRTTTSPAIPIRVLVEAPTFDALGNFTGWVERAEWHAAITVTPTIGYTVTLAHTLLSGTTVPEDVLVTVVDATGAPVTSGIHFTAPDTALARVLTLGLAAHEGSGVWRIPMHAAGREDTWTIIAHNAPARVDSTFEGSTTIRAVAPVVTVTPGGLLTANFYDAITVRVTDPRPAVPVPVVRNITVIARPITAPNGIAHDAATIHRHRTRAETTPAAAWGPWTPGGASGVASSASQQYELLAYRLAVPLSIRDVEQAPQVRVRVVGAPDVFLTLGSASLSVTPAELVQGRINTVTVQLNNARGAIMAARPDAAERMVVFDGMVGDALPAALAHPLSATDPVGIRIRPEPPTTGVMPRSEIGLVVNPDINPHLPTINARLRVVVPVVAPPADTAVPVITTNAPATTTAATVPVTITATDNVAVTQFVFDGVAVTVLPAATASVVRTLTLAVGANTFVVQAADAAGNVATHTFTITLTAPPAPPADTVAPAVTHNAPATTTLESVLVTITATDAVGVTRVIVGGVDVPILPATTVSVVRPLPLAVGANTFVVQAADAAGNVGTVTITITRTALAVERVLPTIEVTAPSITTDATAMITIIARDNVAVTGMIFEGVPVSFFPAAMVTVFRTVDLREGLNSFALSVTDAAGNAAHRVIVIDRRTPAPVVHTITIGRANPAIGLDVPATVRNGRLFVPFRWFAERILEATVDFRVVGAAEIVTMRRGNMHVELTLNSNIAKINGVPVSLGDNVVPFATGGRTLVPARFLAETFGYAVNWNPVTDEVTFTLRP